MHKGMAMAKALIAWPEGKENWSGGRTFAQQCDSRWHGRFLLLAFLIKRNNTTVAASAAALEAKATKRISPPNRSKAIPTEYQTQPSPKRVEAIIQKRNQRGGRQRCTFLMTWWSRAWMNSQNILRAVMIAPHFRELRILPRRCRVGWHRLQPVWFSSRRDETHRLKPVPLATPSASHAQAASQENP